MPEKRDRSADDLAEFPVPFRTAKALGGTGISGLGFGAPSPGVDCCLASSFGEDGFCTITVTRSEAWPLWPLLLPYKDVKLFLSSTLWTPFAFQAEAPAWDYSSEESNANSRILQGFVLHDLKEVSNMLVSLVFPQV